MVVALILEHQIILFDVVALQREISTPLATSLRSYLLPWVTYGRLAEAHVHMVMEFDFDEQDMRMCRLRVQSRIRSFTSAV